MIELYLENSDSQRSDNQYYTLNSKKKNSQYSFGNILIPFLGMCSGFYSGYAEGKGASMGVESNALLLSPPVVSMLYNIFPRKPKNGYMVSQEKYNEIIGVINKSVLKVKMHREPKKDYSELDPSEKRFVNRAIPGIPKRIIMKYLDKKQAEKFNPLENMVLTGSATAFGYSIGKIVSQYI